MFQRIQRILSAICAVVIAAGALSSCSAGTKANTSVPGYIKEDGRFVYSIVRSADSNITVETAAKSIRTAIKENFGCKPTMLKDSAVEDFDGNYEILVGDTNRVESQQAKDILINNRPDNAGDFIVKVIGDKICINAVTDDMIEVAVKWFIANFCGSLEDWALLQNDSEFLYAPDNGDDSTDGSSGLNLGTYTFVKPKSCGYIVGMGAEEILKHLSDLGYPESYITDADAEAEYEVLIGDTTRSDSKAETVEGDNYVIRVKGKKIIVKGGSDLATYRAVKALYDELLKGGKKNSYLPWSDGFVMNGKYDPQEEGVYTLNWGDEFDGNTIDVNKWGDYVRSSQEDTPRTSVYGGWVCSVDFARRSQYTKRTGRPLPNQPLSYVADGSLHLSTLFDGIDSFTGTTVSSYWTMIYKYGCLEIRGKFALAPAASTYWINGASANRNFTRFGLDGTKRTRACMTEIDLVENFGKTTSFASNVHRWWLGYNLDGSVKAASHNSMDGNALYTGASTNNKRYTYANPTEGTDDFHVYTYYWDETCIKFAYDGKVYCDYEYTDNNSVSVHCLANYLIMSCAMGSTTYGAAFNKNTAPDYTEHLVDYVRLYQTGAKNSQMITAWPQDQETGTTTYRYPGKSTGDYY